MGCYSLKSGFADEDECRCVSVSSPYSDSFFRLSERLYYIIFQTAEYQALQIHVQPHPYPCLRLFLKKTLMDISPRVAIILGLGLISHIRRFCTFKSLKIFSALRLPSQSSDIIRFSHRRGGHLTTPWSLQNPPYLLLESSSTAPSGVAQ